MRNCNCKFFLPACTSIKIVYSWSKKQAAEVVKLILMQYNYYKDPLEPPQGPPVVPIGPTLKTTVVKRWLNCPFCGTCRKKGLIVSRKI